jgi:hypothetical protein
MFFGFRLQSENMKFPSFAGLHGILLSMKEDKAQVIIPHGLTDPPQSHEISAAWILERHYNTVVEFLRPIKGYKIKTPDMVMGGLMFEMKSPTGKSKATVGEQFRRASKQSKNIVVDGRRTTIPDNEIGKAIRTEALKRKHLHKIIFIMKDKKVVEVLSKP